MAEIGVDTSSYPKPPAAPAQKSLLDTVGQFQQLETGKVALEQSKLKQINDQFDVMHKTLGALIDENPSKSVAAKRLMEISKTFGLKPEVTSHMISELTQAPNVKTFAENAYIRGLDRQQQLNQVYGTPELDENGQIKTNYSVSQMRGIRQTSVPRQQQIPPGTPTFDANNQPTFQGPTPSITPPGTVATPQPLPSYVKPPIAPTPNNFRSGVSTSTPNNVVAQRSYPAPSGPVAGQTPLFSEGKAAYTADQENASAKMIGVQPAIQALDLMKTPGFNSGPGTKAFQNVVAAAKTWGLIDTAGENDPTVAYQQITKKLADYVSRSPIGQRSDAAQTLKEAASPNPGVQVLPALKKLTEDAIALDRMEAARPGAFKSKNFEEYQNHRSLYPQSMDYRAFKLDQMGDEGPKLVKKMDEQLKKNPNDKEALKFFKSLDIAQKYYQ